MDIKKIDQTTNIFLASFIEYVMRNKSTFEETLVAFMYGVKKLIVSLDRLGMGLTLDKLKEVEQELQKAAEQDIDSKSELLKILKEKLCPKS